MGFNNKAFGVFVYRVRTAAGMTVQQFADAAGITARQNLSRIEAGEILNPSFEAVSGILRAINDLGLIEKHEIDMTDYSPEIIQLVTMYKTIESRNTVVIGGEMKEGKSLTTETMARQPSLALLQKYSLPDMELGLAMVDTASEYPKLKEELQELWREVGKNFSDPGTIDFSRIIHDLTRRSNTLFYKELNRGLKLMANGQSLPQPYKFMILLLRALQTQMDGYGDKQHQEPPKVRRLQRDGDIDFI